ncbi:HoxN/HupN/NixA family nickel/cobalt transporter [Burkholderia gladioli]|uniref:HoxN/HupN/NixA family nickel/cobalt transporter n=1 Tax=Burkholderia gladioli TaxID=28095 RepID=UPI0013648C11|nr:HoxN/HupN/NixA family nickel/cobalt transporter [Burkholderia gladioli]KAF1061868.1 High-affinity nickel transport protein [Burkholderia gladioli]MBU9645544.1 HoxN/HupN/NixA family nickel/cobalt transporter [Burkholderia gladioli]MDN7498739.1 HoxN/HupN/NixA family nickel/cobalt transporter [Burkholderia gladioli]WAG18226.1 HoxN/HupN/NixA family nickel/cobalt transporter [Burkholderia gladioli]
MISRFIGIFSQSDETVRRKLLATYVFLIGLNLLAWLWAFMAFRHHPVVLGTALLAYGFGLRHAVDADHIAAIDNVTRKLMQDGQRPVTVGLFFSLGHASVVILASAAVAVVATALNGRFAHYKAVGSIVSTSVSTGFLLAIAAMNLIILRSIVKTWIRVRNGGAYHDDDFNALLAERGFFSRMFRRVFRVIGASWHMYPLGFLFGLGFDTSTEIALLGISGNQAAQRLSPWAIMVFPILFSAGMSLIDTLDGHLMLGAYGWAYMKPLRKIYYNMTITLISVIAAVVVGGVEALGLVANHAKVSGAFWDAIGALNDNFGTLGYAIIGIFILSWAVSALIYRRQSFDTIEVRR